MSKVMDRINSIFFSRDTHKYHVKALDGIRGLAVLLVMLSHSSNNGIKLFGYLDFRNSGKFGVYLFFVLSAFLLDKQIRLAFQRNKVSLKYWLNYSLRRFLRIFPLFVLALLFHYGLNVFTDLNKLVITRQEDLLKHMFLLKGDSIFWSIPVEFKYYFLSPFIMALCHKVFKWEILPSVLFILAIVVANQWYLTFTNLSLLSTQKFLLFFLFGTILSILPLDGKEVRNSRMYDIIGVFLLIVLFVSIRSNFEVITGKDTYDLAKPKNFYLYGILWSCLLVVTLKSKSFIRWIFELKILIFLGVTSFSLYLFHMPLLRIIQYYKLEFSTINFILFFILSIIFSSFTFLLIEKPLSKVRLQFNNKKEF